MRLLVLQAAAALLGAALAYRSIRRARTRRMDGTIGHYGTTSVTLFTAAGALVGLLSLAIAASVLTAALLA